MIRVLVVDDSVTVRERLVEILRATPGFEVVGQTGDGQRAVELVASLRPDVITLDIVMPAMSGLAATEYIMAHCPTPILIVSSSFNRGEMFDTYAALAAGAVDVLDKSGAGDDGWEQRFVDTVRLVSKIKVITHPRGRLGAMGRAHVATRPPELPAPSPRRQIDVVAIGASTGGPAALSTVLAGITPPAPFPILMVLHIDARFAPAFADWLAGQSQHAIRFAEHGESIAAAGATVLLARADRHLAIARGRIELLDTPARHHCKPSVDVLFETLAAEYGPRGAGCLLTGMGRDGASGLLAIRRAGGATIAQDEATSVIYGMPREAVACGAVERELPLTEIGPAIDALRRRAG